MKRNAILLLAGALAAPAAPAYASFHVMQIEQVIGGVSGNTSDQAVQLRMRFPGQNLMQFSLIRAWDAAGANPVLIVDMTTPVTRAATGNRVLIASPTFAANRPPAPDFLMTNLIPAAYLAAGSLTFEDDGGFLYWRLSWGGAGYTGPGAGDFTNDADGDFNPPFGSALPTAGTNAVVFTGNATAPSTTNVADYALTTGDAVFINNAGASGVVVSPAAGVEPPPPAAIALGRPVPNPASGGMSYSVSLPRAMKVRVQVLDLAGRIVRTLLDGTLPGGQYQRTWNPAEGGSRVASGVYVLRLEAGDVKQSRTFTVTR